MTQKNESQLKAPVRLCCGERHWGPVCPDRKVMCAICWERVTIEELNVLPDGEKEDVCKRCARKESMAEDLNRLSPTARVIREKYTHLKDCTSEDEPDGCTVWLKIDQQSFCVTQYNMDKETGEWTRSQLAMALERLVKAEK